MNYSHWNHGNAAVLRGVWLGKVWFACPVMIVQDNPDLVALYWRAGTRVKQPFKRASAQDFLKPEKVTLVDHTWFGTDILSLTRPGESHSVWAMWETGTSNLRCWYVNLEFPFRRTHLGFDTMDQEMDVVISPDLSQWHWKDEDSFEEMVKAGLYSAEEACAIRAEGERVIKHALANESPFCDGWEKWMPPSEWTIPELPQGWDKI
jgi:Protein of unknown function (DUF402)